MTRPSGLSKEHVKNHPNSGCTQPEFRYLAIGKIIRAHGLRGELSVMLLTDFPERFENMEWVYLGNELEAEAYRLESHRWHKGRILLTLSGVTDRNQAEQLRGQLVQVPLEEAMPLPEGKFYLYELIGLQVMSTEGERLGAIANILETGANDVYVVEDDGQEKLLLPAIPDVVQSIDIANGQMVVNLIDGLI